MIRLQALPAYWYFTRTLDDAPNGTNELVLETVCSKLASEGVPGLNASGTEMNRPENLLLKFFYEHGNLLYSARSLFRFKNKFEPVWEPQYAYCTKDFGIQDIYLLFSLFYPSGVVGLTKKRIVSEMGRKRQS